MDRFTSYAQLAVAFDEGRDFVLHVRRGDEDVAVIAPHGGLIEPGTLEIADEIAGAVFDFYAFEAKIENAFQRMHITSTLFDEPRCLDLISTCRRVLAVHGVAESTHRLLVGGLDSGLRDSIVAALVQNGFAAEAVFVGRLSATDPTNVCNRGRSGAGVQVEIGRVLRDELRGDPRARSCLADCIRSAIWSSP